MIWLQLTNYFRLVMNAQTLWDADENRQNNGLSIHDIILLDVFFLSRITLLSFGRNESFVSWK